MAFPNIEDSYNKKTKCNACLGNETQQQQQQQQQQDNEHNGELIITAYPLRIVNLLILSVFSI